MFNPAVDAPGLATGGAELLLGLLFFPSICLACQTFLRSSSRGRDFVTKNQISSHGIHDISNKVTSSIFAVFACTIGWLVNRQCTGDVMHDRFYILDNYLIFGVSYFFYDVVSMYLVYSTITKADMQAMLTLPLLTMFGGHYYGFLQKNNREISPFYSYLSMYRDN